MNKENQFESYGILMPLGRNNNEPLPIIRYTARPLIHVWTEGYAATGEHGVATYWGCCLADSFIEACETLVKGLDRNNDGSLRLHNGAPSTLRCSCFDNEIDARKSHG